MPHIRSCGRAVPSTSHLTGVFAWFFATAVVLENDAGKEPCSLAVTTGAQVRAGVTASSLTLALRFAQLDKAFLTECRLLSVPTNRF